LYCSASEEYADEEFSDDGCVSVGVIEPRFLLKPGAMYWHLKRGLQVSELQISECLSWKNDFVPMTALCLG
jgi:hypothetical protein